MNRRPIDYRRPGMILAASATIALVVGCGNDGSTAGAVGAGTEATRATYEDHEHHVPAHKPVSFPDAVDSLRRRTKELRWLLTASRRERTIATRRAELDDVVGWLPILGADSDLTEVEWQPIARAAADLEWLYPQVFTASGNVRDEAFTAIDRTLDTLAAVVESHPNAFEVVPHPDHHHGHDHDHDH